MAVKEIKISIAAHAVAAGIFDRKARITVSLVPIVDANGHYDLAQWPDHANRFLDQAKLYVVPVNATNGWRKPDYANPPKLENLERKSDQDEGELGKYWQAVMGDEAGFEALEKALTPDPQKEMDPLDAVLRPGSKPDKTPDFHGTRRSKTAVKHSFERAQYTASRLKGSPPPTVAAANARFAMSKKVKDWKKVGPFSEQKKEIDDAIAARMLAVFDAWHELGPSRARADDWAEARRSYQDTGTSASNAISALTAVQKEFLENPPALSALQVTDKAGTRGVPLPAPNVTNEARAAYLLASRTPEDLVVANPQPDPNHHPTPTEIEFARLRLFAIQNNPSLGRLFRFVVDFTCPLADLSNAAKKAFGFADILPGTPDVCGPPSAVPAAASTPANPAADAQATRFVLLGLFGAGDAKLWTATKFRADTSHFLPCTREEIDARVAGCSVGQLRKLAIAEQIDGIVDLGQRLTGTRGDEYRYDILTLDPVTTVAREDNEDRMNAEKADIVAAGSLPPNVAADLSSLQQATQRGGGLALADRWRQMHAISRHLDSLNQRDMLTGNTHPNIVLDASDLTMGYKLDVGIRPSEGGRNYWHTLMHRRVAYTPTAKVSQFAPRNLNKHITSLYPDAAARQEADDGQLHVPAAMRDWTQDILPKFRDVQLNPTDDPKPNWTTAFTEEIIGAWRGDPLGLSCGKEQFKRDPDDLRIDMTYTLPSLTDGPGAIQLTPPPLRFGWRYHFALRAVFAGGVSQPLSRARTIYKDSFGGDLVRPAAPDDGYGFVRHERIDAPGMAVPDWMFGTLTPAKNYTKVTLNGRYPAPQAGRMVVRSLDDDANRVIADVPDEGQESLPGVGFDRRVLIAPPVAMDFAALHDAFRDKTGEEYIQTKLKMADARVLRDTEDPDHPDDPDTFPISGEEEELSEYVPVLEAKGPDARPVWREVRVAWRPHLIQSRPRGGLKNVDYGAAWGGFPIYRASTTIGDDVEIVVGQPAPRRPALMTDEGEILHRSKSDDRIIFKNDPKKTRTITWEAAGGAPSGATVFRLGGDPKLQRQPYYPDPAAVTLVIEVTLRGQKGADGKPIRQVQNVSLYKTEQKGPVPEDYPDSIPVVLDVVRGALNKPLAIKVQTRRDYAGLPNTPADAVQGKPIQVTHVTVTLAPGDEAVIRTWCVPNETFLAYMWGLSESLAALAIAYAYEDGPGQKKLLGRNGNEVDKLFVTGVKSLTSIELDVASPDRGDNVSRVYTALGGLPLPGPARRLEFAKKIRAYMLDRPLPEVAAVTEIEAVHAVDLPQQKPRLAMAEKWPLLRASPTDIEYILGRSLIDPPSDPVYKPENWSLENQKPGAVDVLLNGKVGIHGPSTSSVEIRAKGTAAARGRFDDVDRGRSRDDRARGTWPKPDSQNYMLPKRLFGFDPQPDGSVTFEKETVTLLRLEGFDPGVKQIDFLEFQRRARELEKLQLSPNDSPPPDYALRAQRPASFPDAKARYIELLAVGISRHTASLRTRYDELPELLAAPATSKSMQPQAQEIAQTIARVWLPATVCPARPIPLSPIPSFAWSENPLDPPSAKHKEVFTRRSMCVRVRLKRPWFSSGEGERLGVVVWPPNLFSLSGSDVSNDLVKPLPDDRAMINLRNLPPDGSNSSIQELQDADLGPGGSWVTRWGADPIRAHGGVSGWLLSKDNFPECVPNKAALAGPPEQCINNALLVERVLMPVPVDADAPESTAAKPPGGFMSVSLITYAPRFDPEQENWFVDINVSPCGAIYPFLRLGLVRFQPHAPSNLQVSEPVVEWVQIMPERKVHATAQYTGKDKTRVVVRAVVEGPASGTAVVDSLIVAQAPRMSFSMLRRRAPEDDEPSGSEVIYLGPMNPAPQCEKACMSWAADFEVDSKAFGGSKWSIFVEEVDQLRPATYLDEPRYETLKDSNFADTGPRFTARLSLDNLLIM